MPTGEDARPPSLSPVGKALQGPLTEGETEPGRGRVSRGSRCTGPGVPRHWLRGSRLRLQREGGAHVAVHSTGHSARRMRVSPLLPSISQADTFCAKKAEVL